MKSSQASENSQSFDRHQLWESFYNDRELRAQHRITDAEVEVLHTMFLLGDYRDKHDLIEALELLRRGWHS
jgi:hypothetical protein